MPKQYRNYFTCPVCSSKVKRLTPHMLLHRDRLGLSYQCRLWPAYIRLEGATHIRGHLIVCAQCPSINANIPEHLRSSHKLEAEVQRLRKAAAAVKSLCWRVPIEDVYSFSPSSTSTVSEPNPSERSEPEPLEPVPGPSHSSHTTSMRTSQRDKGKGNKMPEVFGPFVKELCTIALDYCGFLQSPRGGSVNPQRSREYARFNDRFLDEYQITHDPSAAMHEFR